MGQMADEVTVVIRPYYRGKISRIFELQRPLNPKQVSDLLVGDKLVTSSNGLNVATVLTNNHEKDVVDHNLEGVECPTFLHGARILEVKQDCIKIWGTPVGELNCGVYEINTSGFRRIQSMTSISRICRSHNGFILFGQRPPNNDDIALTEFGTCEMDGVISAITTRDNRYLFLEKLDKKYYRYFVGEDGFQCWNEISIDLNERPRSIVVFQNRFLFLSHGSKSSSLRLLGEGNQTSFQIKEHWDGTIEQLFVSPDENSIVWIVKPDLNKKSFRQIYLNGEMIFEGEFIIREGDLVWAKNGSMCGVFVTIIPDDMGRIPTIVTPTVQYRFPPDRLLREFLVDDTGRVAATIVDDGNFCIPTVYGRTHDSVPLAWNLHVCDDGSIGYNSIQTSHILHTNDETEFAERQD